MPVNRLPDNDWRPRRVGHQRILPRKREVPPVVDDRHRAVRVMD